MNKHQKISSCLLICFLSIFQLYGMQARSADPTPWTPVSYEVRSAGFSSFVLAPYQRVFQGSDQGIVQLAPELLHLKGIRLPLGEQGAQQETTLQLSFNEPARLLIGIAKGEKKALEVLKASYFQDGRIENKPLLRHAMMVTETDEVDVYGVLFPEGTHELKFPLSAGNALLVLGAISSQQQISGRDAEIAGGKDYEAFFVDGFSDDNPLFTVIGGQDDPVLDEGMPGTEEILGGFEGGECIKLNGVYHLFPTERKGEKGVPAYFDRVKTRIGHWTSTDAIHWKRVGTLYESSGTYAVSPEDNPANDRRAAIWSYMPVFNQQKNRWYGYYLAYTVDKEIKPNHSFGRIWRCESEVEGIDGIGGPYRDAGIVMEPGLDSYLWEGRQGVASLFPYPVGDKWLGFYSGAYPFHSKADYPDQGGKGWYVGLAEADSLEGPWKRLDSTINPVTSIHPWFVENPIVSKLPNGLYIAVFDGGPENLNLPNLMGYSLSKDGLHWSRARYIPFDVKVKKWWHTMRTPLCLIPEGNGEYTVVYAAINNSKRFHPMGMVKLKMDEKVLGRLKRELK